MSVTEVPVSCQSCFEALSICERICKDLFLCILSHFELTNTEFLLQRFADLCPPVRRCPYLPGVILPPCSSAQSSDLTLRQLRLSSSPCDFFFYNNLPQYDAPNCHTHVDPGMLTLVPCCTTPGLAIFSPRLKQWCSVESLPTRR